MSKLSAAGSSLRPAESRLPKEALTEYDFTIGHRALSAAALPQLRALVIEAVSLTSEGVIQRAQALSARPSEQSRATVSLRDVQPNKISVRLAIFSRFTDQLANTIIKDTLDLLAEVAAGNLYLASGDPKQAEQQRAISQRDGGQPAAIDRANLQPMRQAFSTLFSSGQHVGVASGQHVGLAGNAPLNPTVNPTPSSGSRTRVTRSPRLAGAAETSAFVATDPLKTSTTLASTLVQANAAFSAEVSVWRCSAANIVWTYRLLLAVSV